MWEPNNNFRATYAKHKFAAEYSLHMFIKKIAYRSKFHLIGRRLIEYYPDKNAFIKYLSLFRKNYYHKLNETI